MHKLSDPNQKDTWLFPQWSEPQMPLLSLRAPEAPRESSTPKDQPRPNSCPSTHTASVAPTVHAAFLGS